MILRRALRCHCFSRVVRRSARCARLMFAMLRWLVRAPSSSAFSCAVAPSRQLSPRYCALRCRCVSRCTAAPCQSAVDRSACCAFACRRAGQHRLCASSAVRPRVALCCAALRVQREGHHVRVSGAGAGRGRQDAWDRLQAPSSEAMRRCARQKRLRRRARRPTRDSGGRSGERRKRERSQHAQKAQNGRTQTQTR